MNHAQTWTAIGIFALATKVHHLGVGIVAAVRHTSLEES